MTVYVDNSRLSWRGNSWCHLVADSISELHAFAAQLGLRREWFQEKTMYPHYDVTVTLQQRALALGAEVGDKSTIITCAKRLRSELSQHAHVGQHADQPQQKRAHKKAAQRDDPSQQALFGS